LSFFRSILLSRPAKLRIYLPLLAILLAIVFTFIASLSGETGTFAQATQPSPTFAIIGQLLDPQGQPVVEADVLAYTADPTQPLVETQSRSDGSWLLNLTDLPQTEFHILIEHPHFFPQELTLDQTALGDLRQEGVYRLGSLSLARRISASFWAAALIFLGVILAIAFERMHSTTAALAGLSAIFLITYTLGASNPAWFIFSFERGLSYINWEVIFLVMGMMIIIAIIEGTGIFQWMAFQAYRLSRGRTWLLALILMGVTALASALLDNFTTMLLMTPISMQIALALGINPLALIIPEILASNVGGISTLVGTPTNILIGAYAGIGFTDFLVNQTTGVLIALLAMAGYVLFHYCGEFRKQSSSISPVLYEKLKDNARVEDPRALLKSGLVFLLVLVGFVLGEKVSLAPAVPALIGATALLIWLKPNVHQMIIAVDWTTLVFFMALFIVVGAIQEVGLLGFVAEGMSRLIGENLALGVFVIIFGVGTLSTAVANIPLAASMLPIVKFLTASIPGANSLVLYYALSMGAAMGGNGLLIGGEANLVTAGITAQTDTPIKFKDFLKIGLPVTYLTLTVGFLWLLIRF
jgi:Na+/H+ antiporter NhaD/arsenite permease-like protein